jgi:hypothetical protein
MSMSLSFTSEAFHKIQENWTVFLGITVLVYALNEFVIYPFYTSPLAKIPGPKLYAATNWWIMLLNFTGKRTKTLHELHKKYGNIIRIAPNELHLSGEEPMKVIYGAGTVFSKPAFYNLFVA